MNHVFPTKTTHILQDKPVKVRASINPVKNNDLDKMKILPLERS